MPLFLTYDSETITDGYGAQLLRILGIFAISKTYGCRYLHTGITETVEEFSHQVNSEQELHRLTKSVNSFFALPSSLSPIAFDKVIYIKSPGFKEFLKIIIRYKYSRHNVLLKLCLPFRILHLTPGIYECATKEICKNNFEIFDQWPAPELVLHLRMSHGRQNVPETQPRRHLPISYFRDTLKKLSEDSRKIKAKKISVHTDLSSKEVNWRPTEKTLLQEVSLGEVAKDGVIRVQAHDVSKFFSDFSNYEFEVRYCDDFFSTFLDMATCHTLVQARSALSYLAGLFNKNLVIWPSSHGHPKLKKWKSSDDLGIHLREQLIRG
jgi:hypothetical protein